MTIVELAEQYGLTIQEVRMIPWVESLLDKAGEEPSAPDVEWVGQPEVMDQIEPFLKQPHFPHTLILGVPGIGKTHLARWIASQRDEPFQELLCPVTPDRLSRDGIVLLDECHKQRNPEPLFPLMEKRHVTLIGATTRPENLEPAFKSRFFLTLNLGRYDQNSMETLISNVANSKSEGLVSDDWIRVLARAAGGNPRQALRLVDTAEALGSYHPTDVLAACRVTADGLTDTHLNYLRTLDQIGRPVGVGQIAVTMYSDESTVKETERLLLDVGLVMLLSNGRVLTRKGKRYMELLNGR